MRCLRGGLEGGKAVPAQGGSESHQRSLAWQPAVGFSDHYLGCHGCRAEVCYAIKAVCGMEGALSPNLRHDQELVLTEGSGASTPDLRMDAAVRQQHASLHAAASKAWQAAAYSGGSQPARKPCPERLMCPPPLSCSAAATSLLGW